MSAATPTGTPVLAYQLQIVILDSSGRPVDTVFDGAVAGPISDLQSSSQTLNVDGFASIRFSLPSGTLAASWDGHDSRGRLVAPGSYFVQAQWSGPGGNQVRAFTVQAFRTPDGMAGHAILAPNPARPGDPSVTLFWDIYGTQAFWRAAVYDLAGELVAQVQAPGSAGSMAWNLRGPSGASVASGIYIWKVQALDSHGTVSGTRIIKLAVLQ